jgi:hypothetical protein
LGWGILQVEKGKMYVGGQLYGKKALKIFPIFNSGGGMGQNEIMNEQVQMALK